MIRGTRLAQGVLDAIYAAERSRDSFGWLAPLTDAVPCDSATIFALGPGGDLADVVGWPSLGVINDAFRGAFRAHMGQCDLCRAPERVADRYGVARLSALYPHPEDHAHTAPLAHFRHVMGRASLVMSLGADEGQSARLFCSKQGGLFSNDAVLMLALLRPHLDFAYRRSTGMARTASLTPRQRDVLRLLARGCTNQQISSMLSLSVGTVRKHVENIYGALDVHNRGSAVAATRLTPELISSQSMSRNGRTVSTPDHAVKLRQ